MAPCPKCGVPVAHHGEKKLKCWECGALLKYKPTGKDDAGLSRHVWVVVKRIRK